MNDIFSIRDNYLISPLHAADQYITVVLTVNVHDRQPIQPEFRLDFKLHQLRPPFCEWINLDG